MSRVVLTVKLYGFKELKWLFSVNSILFITRAICKIRRRSELVSIGAMAAWKPYTPTRRPCQNFFNCFIPFHVRARSWVFQKHNKINVFLQTPYNVYYVNYLSPVISMVFSVCLITALTTLFLICSIRLFFIYSSCSFVFCSCFPSFFSLKSCTLS